MFGSFSSAFKLLRRNPAPPDWSHGKQSFLIEDKPLPPDVDNSGSIAFILKTEHFIMWITADYSVIFGAKSYMRSDGNIRQFEHHLIRRKSNSLFPVWNRLGGSKHLFKFL